MGQGPLLPIPPAIANAAHDAVGVRVDEVPITPDKVLRALAARDQGREGRVVPSGFPDLPWPEIRRVPAPGEPATVRVPRERPVLPPLDTRPLVQVETRPSAQSLQ